MTGTPEHAIVCTYKDAYCTFCKRVIKVHIVQNGDAFTAVCGHKGCRGPKRETADAAWRSWEGKE